MVVNSDRDGGTAADGRFALVTAFTPRGDQPEAIAAVARRFEDGVANQVLLGITGSGKTFTMAKVIERLGRPALVLAHNKTLAAQLYSELKALFPANAVEYFVSYYDYYQPEAYVPSTNTYIEKDASINERIDRLRHSATRSLLTRRDVIIVASVSCIYGIGAAEDYGAMLIRLEAGARTGRDALLRRLVDGQYDRNDVDFARGTFRVRGDVVEIFPVYEDERAVRVEFFGDEIERLSEIDPLRGEVLRRIERTALFPGSHYAAPADKLRAAIERIREELRGRLAELGARGKLVERQRLEERTMYDLERLEQLGHCPGIENYSRHLAGRAAGEPPATLLDYFPRDFLTFIDESHQTVPQIGAMSRGDRARKETLVEFGFRLPSAIDNRPLSLAEFEARVGQVCFVSATPAAHELARAGGEVAEQVIRPTGLTDPAVAVRPAAGQVDDLLGEIRARVARGQRVLVTTLTKRMAEELTEYYEELGVRVRYLHSDIETLERSELLRALRAGDYDVLVGINLLREGLDLPEVALVAVLDADKEGFLRSARSLVQTIGRAARNVDGTVIMYADKVTAAMDEAIRTTRERRARQEAYNARHGITPTTIRKAIGEIGPGAASADYAPLARRSERAAPGADPAAVAEALREEMLAAAEALDFERAAALRDELLALCADSGVKLGARGKGKGGGGRRRR